MKNLLLIIVAAWLLNASVFASAQPDSSNDGIWERVYEPDVTAVNRNSTVAGLPNEFNPGDKLLPLLHQNVFLLNRTELEAGIERPTPFSAESAIVSMPMPDGSFTDFLFTPSSLLSPELASRYPDIKTWSIVSLQNPEINGQADLTPLGFHALVLTPEGSFQIAPDPDLNAPFYISFYEKHLPDQAVYSCTADSHASPSGHGLEKNLPDRLMASGVYGPVIEIDSGDTLRTYELAVATTSQYYSGRGNSDAAVLASITTVMNKVDLILRTEVAISLSLIGETDDLFFTDDSAYTSDGNACNLKDENQAVVDGVLDADDYDIGFVLDARSNTGGGCASGAVVCGANKARGSAGLDTGQVAGHEGFGGYRLVLHEMGHQFGAGHTWSGQVGNCTADQFSQPDAFEPGGGTTLMSYSGTCGPIGADGIQMTTGDTYFHGHSFDEIVTFSTGAGDACAAKTATNNQAPAVNAGPDFTIPRQTPYVLSGSANDPDGDPLTYTWEQFDVASMRVPLGTDDGTGPIVRSRIPGPDPSRTIPPWDDILSNTSSAGELLTATNRTLNFRLTARDNQTVGGGVDSDSMVVTVEGSPFFIDSPNGGEFLNAGCPANVLWTVGGGDEAANVDLSLSTDSGSSFQALMLGVANDGEQEIASIGCTATTGGRVMAMASDNIFFDVSDNDFTIVEQAPQVTVSATGGAVDEACTFTVTFEAEVTDDCSVNTADVAVDVVLPNGNGMLGVPTINTQQVDERTVAVDGSVLVSALTDSPAEVFVTVEAIDGCGFDANHSDKAVVVDNTPPSIDVSLSPDRLWAPNHKMRDITATVEVEDNCDADPEIVLLAIDSNEPENDDGDGNTEPDIAGADLVTPDFEFQLRAERQGGGIGRIYTVTYGTADDSGNMAEASAVVKVPTNGKKK